MGYREERDALQARADALEEELVAVRGELARTKDTVRALRGQLDAAQRPRRAASKRGSLLVGTALALLGLSIAALLVARPSRPLRALPPPASPLPHPAVPPPPRPLETEVRTTDVEAPAEAGPSRPAAITSARSPRPR